MTLYHNKVESMEAIATRGVFPVTTSPVGKGGNDGKHIHSHSPWSEKNQQRSFIVTFVVRMLLVAMPGAPSSVLAPGSDALCY